MLDRLLENSVAVLLDAESGGIQCVPGLVAGGEPDAVLPRIVVTCESQESPDFQEAVGYGIYALYPVRTIVSCICEGTSPTSTGQLGAMNAAVDAVLVYNGGLAQSLTDANIECFGVVPGECVQERSGNRIIRHRRITIWARIQAEDVFVIDDTTGDQVVDDTTGEEVISD